MNERTIKKLTIDYLSLLESWFVEKYHLPKKRSAIQKFFGHAGLVIGISSSIVIFFLSYNFGIYLGKLYLPNWELLLGFYFGITAVIPLSLLAGRTSSFVLQNIIKPPHIIEDKIFDNGYQSAKRRFNIVVWCIAILSTIPFFYLTHTYLYPLISWWVFPFDIAATIAPIFVNSWALSSASDNLIYFYYQIKKNILKIELASHQSALLLIEQKLDYISYMISRLHKAEAERIFLTLHHNAHQNGLKEIFNLASLNNQNLKLNIPLGERLFSYCGAIIGAISEYQYFGTGMDAALWLHAPYSIAFIVGIAALICNSTLMGYTGRIVFREIYSWLDRQWLKLKRIENVFEKNSTINTQTQKPFYEWLKIYIKKAFGDLTNIIILIIAISAATPNVYLTILQQKSVAWYNFIWLLIAFLGPFCTNFYALSRVLHNTNSRQQLLNMIANIINTLPHFKPKYLITLKYLANMKHPA